ncbi:hypothetical protein TNCV_3837131 [Trichonephila clavipes]|nr:hypothetical protein TNCV_3837131 [Trichonephila clavipes]
MSVQRFLKLDEALELLNSFDCDVEITVLPPDASELTDEDDRDDNEVNTGEITVKDVSDSLEVRSGDRFQAEPPTAPVFRQQNAERKLKDINYFG